MTGVRKESVVVALVNSVVVGACRQTIGADTLQRPAPA